MGKRLFYWEVAGFLWVGTAGAALRFFYGRTGGAAWAAAFSAVNTSVWEQMKMLFVPLFLLTMAQVWFLGYPNLLAVRAVTAALGTLAIPVLHYTYTGALGVRWAWADALLFLAADAGLFLPEYCLLRRGALNAGWAQVAGLVSLWAALFAFVWCSYRPPALPVFMG